MTPSIVKVVEFAKNVPGFIQVRYTTIICLLLIHVSLLLTMLMCSKIIRFPGTRTSNQIWVVSVYPRCERTAVNVKCLLTYGRVWGFVQLFRLCADILMNNYLSIPKSLHLLLEVGFLLFTVWLFYQAFLVDKTLPEDWTELFMKKSIILWLTQSKPL